MELSELAAAIFRIAHLSGEFTLRSGRTSSEYFDKYRFESRPELLSSIAEHLKRLVPSDCAVLAGLEMGGIPIATALSLATGIPAVFVRKSAKPYGTRRLAEGLPTLAGMKTCIIEDVITTGGQVILSAEDLRGEGAVVEDVLCVISRQEGGEEKLRSAGLRMRSLFTTEQLRNPGTI